ncbi:MAG: hypothetical protein SFY81_03945 [Verrucomicrobiota bacterium]|nr:hypothetical protein [Verrucomicrobiota bacterium]
MQALVMAACAPVALCDKSAIGRREKNLTIIFGPGHLGKWKDQRSENNSKNKNEDEEDLIAIAKINPPKINEGRQS